MTGGPGESSQQEHVLHELRTPLSVIKGSLVALAGHWDRIEDERRSELLQRASDNVDLLAAAISELGGAVTSPGREEGRAGFAITAISVVRLPHRLRVEVTVAGRRGTVVGRSDSAPGRYAERRAVAEAVVDALDARARVEEAEVVEVGSDRVATVRLGRDGVSLVGAALMVADEYDALAHATLHALERAAGMAASSEPGAGPR